MSLHQDFNFNFLSCCMCDVLLWLNNNVYTVFYNLNLEIRNIILLLLLSVRHFMFHNIYNTVQVKHGNKINKIKQGNKRHLTDDKDKPLLLMFLFSDSFLQLGSIF